MKNKIAAALFAFFLGGFGVHRFYLGQVGLGFLYLIFCWTFIPVVIGFIDFIVFLCMSDRDFDVKYNRNYQSQGFVQQVPHKSNSGNVAEEIERLHSLKERGIISNDEFEIRKSKLLS